VAVAQKGQQNGYKWFLTWCFHSPTYSKGKELLEREEAMKTAKIISSYKLI
jgi:hypothetical protein